MGRKTAINALILSRATFGVAVWLFPRPVGKAFGLVSDFADTVAAIAGGVGGYLPKRTRIIRTVAALAPVFRGAIALRGQ